MADERPLAWLGRTVDIGFFALVAACAVRYYAVHPFAGLGVVVLVLATGACFAYLIAVLGASNAIVKRAGVLTATALWFPLVLLAPSFGWTAFALFFAVHRVLPRTPARWLSSAIVLAVSVGLYFLSDGQDLGLMFGPLLGGIVLSVVYVQLDRVLDNRNRLIQQLREAQDQLTRSERETGALTERMRVASELHDTVVQQTASALMLLESTEQRDPRVQEASHLMRGTLTETRQLMSGLTQPRKDLGSVAASLTELANEHGAEMFVMGEVRAVPDEVLHALLRITQEALTNVRKHASATRVSVTLTFFANEVGVDIADDGRGVVTSATGCEEKPLGYGLRAMAWRAQTLGGTFHCESAENEGTVVGALIPDVNSDGAST